MTRTILIIAALIIVGFVIFGFGSMGEDGSSVPQESATPHAIDQ